MLYWALGSDQCNLCDDTDATAPEQVRDHRARQTSGVVFHPDGLSRLIDLNATNAVHLFEIAQSEHRGLRGLLLVAEEYVDVRHSGMIDDF